MFIELNVLSPVKGIHQVRTELIRYMRAGKVKDSDQRIHQGTVLTFGHREEMSVLETPQEIFSLMKGEDNASTNKQSSRKKTK